MEYKGFQILNDETGFKYIKVIGRGSIPASLRGIFTNTRFAQVAIDNEKAKRDGEANSTN